MAFNPALKQRQQQSVESPKEEKHDDSTPVSLIIRNKDGWRLYNQNCLTGALTAITLNNENCIDAPIVFSSDGSYFAVLSKDYINIFNGFNGNFLLSLPHFKVRSIYFSPLNNYLVSYNHRSNNDKDGNVWVWKLDFNNIENNQNNIQNNDNNIQNTHNSNKVIYRFFINEFDINNLPLSFSNDEFICSRVSGALNSKLNSLIIFDLPRLQYLSNNILLKINNLNRLRGVSIAPVPYGNGPNSIYYFSTFELGAKQKNKGCIVSIYSFNYQNKLSNLIINQSIMGGIDTCLFLWNKYDSNSMNNNENTKPILLTSLSSDHDTSGSNYYGNSCVYLLNLQNNISKRICESLNNSRLHCCKWHPNSLNFFIIDGYPMQLKQYNNNGELITKYGEMARNNIIFSKGHYNNTGRFMCVFGFGNLNGEMSFYDCFYNKKLQKHSSKSNNIIAKNIKQIGYNQDDSCRYYEYAPNGLTMLCARTYEFRKIDNGFSIYQNNGKLLFHYKTERLFQVLYRPSLSVNKNYQTKDPIIDINNQNLISNEQIEKQKQKTKYIPPHLRNKVIKEQEIDESYEKNQAKKLKNKQKKFQKKLEKEKALKKAMENDDDWGDIGIVKVNNKNNKKNKINKTNKNNNNNNNNNDEPFEYDLNFDFDYEEVQGSDNIIVQGSDDNDNDNNDVESDNNDSNNESNTSETPKKSKRRRKRKSKNKIEEKPGLMHDDNTQWPRGSRINNKDDSNNNSNEIDTNDNENQQSGGKSKRRRRRNKNKEQNEQS